MPASTSKIARKTPARKTSPRPRAVRPAPEPAQPASTSYGAGWNRGTSVEAGEDLELPSGNVCRVRSSLGMQGMVGAGLVEDLDSLSTMVKSRAATKKMTAVEKKALTKKLQGDKKALVEGLELVDRVVVYSVLEPKVSPELTAEEIADRVAAGLPQVDPNTIYVSGVDEADKMFIFNFVTEGQRDLEQFRAELAESVGGLE